ncbi:MAG: beta-ketoacyl-ACP synthase III [Candidatus Caenarcaniphilales bacterium]|nr:beta-ketoacyl-ACP synthase III [Candidatus Caenarcaniphilales bacterium]
MSQKPFGVKLTGVGSATPSKVVSNFDLEKLIDTNDEWIKTRTGIGERRVCEFTEENTETLDLSVKAAQKALGQTPASEIDLIIVCTSTPDYLYPSTACRLQHALGATKAVAFDLSAACTGFVYGLVTASQFLQLGTYSKVLLVGVDIHSRFLDWSDRATSILFGDGAGAVLLERTSTEKNQLLAHSIHSDGRGACDLYLKTVGMAYPQASSQKQVETVHMNGKKIYHFAVKTIPETLAESAGKANLTVDNIDYLICHQANQRILDSVAERLHWPKEKCISNIAKYGNTSAASIPLALDENFHKFKENNIVAFVGFGAGLTWGSVIWKWGE